MFRVTSSSTKTTKNRLKSFLIRNTTAFFFLLFSSEQSSSLSYSSRLMFSKFLLDLNDLVRNFDGHRRHDDTLLLFPRLFSEEHCANLSENGKTWKIFRVWIGSQFSSKYFANTTKTIIQKNQTSRSLNKNFGNHLHH